MKRIALLDNENRLIGTQEVSDDAQGIVISSKSDLPLDGSYVYRDDAFWPLGYGFHKPSAPPVAPDHAMYLVMRAMLDGTPPPLEVRAYADWYKDVILPRVEEKIVGDKRRVEQSARMIPRRLGRRAR